MQPWTWLVAYVVGFALLQILLYRRFHQQTPASDGAGGATEGQGGRLLPGESGSTTSCEHCETVNERHTMVRYCRSCVHPLR